MSIISEWWIGLGRRKTIGTAENSEVTTYLLPNLLGFTISGGNKAACKQSIGFPPAVFVLRMLEQSQIPNADMSYP